MLEKHEKNFLTAYRVISIPFTYSKIFVIVSHVENIKRIVRTEVKSKWEWVKILVGS